MILQLIELGKGCVTIQLGRGCVVIQLGRGYIAIQLGRGYIAINWVEDILTLIWVEGIFNSIGWRVYGRSFPLLTQLLVLVRWKFIGSEHEDITGKGNFFPFLRFLFIVANVPFYILISS